MQQKREKDVECCYEGGEEGIKKGMRKAMMRISEKGIWRRQRWRRRCKEEMAVTTTRATTTITITTAIPVL